MPERFITVKDAAEQLQVHPQTVRVWLREGKLRGRLIGGRKRAATAFQRARSAVSYHRKTPRKTAPSNVPPEPVRPHNRDSPCHQEHARRPLERGTVQAGPGCGAEPRFKQIAPKAHRFRAERGAGP
jgi:excisionase family DNA binding protein